MIKSESLGKLAAEIGENVYIDVAKWHLYLRDAHLHNTVAQQLSPLIENNTVNEQEVLDVLRRIPVKLGGGKREIPLLDLLPMQSVVHLMDAIEEYQKYM